MVYVGDWAVGVNGSEMYVTLDAKTRGIADYAFYGATVLEVNIPQTVEIIGRAAFLQLYVFAGSDLAFLNRKHKRLYVLRLYVF